MDRAIARYRLILKASTGAFGAGIVFTAVGLLTLVFADDPALLSAGLFLVSFSGLNAYRAVVRTMHLLDAEARTG